MTAKDFKYIAFILKSLKVLMPQLNMNPVIEAFVVMLNQEYPRFNEKVFRKAATVVNPNEEAN